MRVAQPSVRPMDENRTSELKRRDILQKGVATGAFVVGGTALTGTAVGKQGKSNCTLNYGQELNARHCDGQGGPVMNVRRRVVNGIDTGLDGPWARDNFEQHIRVWEQSSGSYCVIMKWQGQFDAFEGAPSPGGSGITLTGDENGSFEGGARITFTGEFTPGSKRTHGSLGTYDQGCEQTTASCKESSTTGWIDDYFSTVANLSLPWWGAIYHGGNCGTWVNAIDKTCGDIYCE